MSLNIGIGIGIPRFGLSGGGSGPDIYAQAALYMDFANNAARLNGVWGPAVPQLTCTRASVAQMDNSDGWWGPFLANTPRWSDKGLLVEEARTNSIRNNTMAGAVAGTPGTLPTNWGYVDLAVGVSTQIVGVGNEKGVDYIDVRFFGTPADAAGITIIFEPIAFIAATPGQVWSGSVFLALKAGSFSGLDTDFALQLDDFDSGTGYLSTIALAGLAGLTGTLTRIAVSGTNVASTAFIVPDLFGSTFPGVPIDFTIRIGWPQLELGAFVTSPIKTSSVAVTRNTDIITLASFAGLSFSATGGTLFDEAMVPSVQAVAQTPLCVDDGTSNERYVLRASSGAMAGLVVDGGAIQASLAVGTLVANAPLKSALAYAANDIAFTSNGATPGTDATATLPTVTTFMLGGRTTAAIDTLNGYLRRVAYWNSRLTNAQLQAITA